MKSNLFFRLFLVLFSFLAFSGEAAAQTACTTIPAPQFSQSTNTSKVMNGVTVTRTLSRALYSPVTTNTTGTPQCTPSLAAGYAWLRAEDVSTNQTVTYTFSQPQTSVQVFLLLMGNAGQPNSADRADFSVNNGTISISKNPNDNSIDCLGKITISSNTVQVNNLANNTTNGAVSVSSTVPFTTLTVTNVRTNIYRSTVDGYGYFVEICPSSVKCVAPAVPTVTTQAATCASAGTATITNYSTSNTYTFSPTGPTVGAGGVISGLTSGTSYAVNASAGTCASENSASFSVQAKLETAAITGTLTALVGSTSQLTGTGTKAGTNPWVSSNTAVATVSANGLVTGVSLGTSTITYTNNAGCSAQATFKVTNVQRDWDGDGVADATDLDDDNDGILDTAEMYCDQTVPPNGTFPVSNNPLVTPAFTKQLLFFNWSGYTTIGNGATTFVVHNGVTYTATISNYKGEGLIPSKIATYSAAIVGKYYEIQTTTFLGALKNSANTSTTTSFDMTISAKVGAVEYPVEVVVFDAESTNAAQAGTAEKLVFTVDASGSPFTLLEKLGTGTIAENIELTNNSKTLTYKNTQTSNVNALYRTTGYSPKISASNAVSTSQQAFGFAVRLYCDTDGDAIPNFLDTDSDNDGCPDATEGANRYATTGTLSGGSNGGSTANLGTTVNNTNGIPTAAGSGQATTAGVTTPVRIVAGTTPPAALTATSGSTVTLTSNATAETATTWGGTPGYAPNYITPGNTTGLTYSWTKNGVSVTNGPGIAGATTATLTLTGVTAESAGTYVVTVKHPNNNCQVVTASTVLSMICYNDANTTGTGLDTKHGITLLKRAGSGTAQDNWPMVRKGAHTALESNTKGFVITRMNTAEITAITAPQEGMMVYDSDLNCLKLYDGTAWSCFSKPACP